MYTCITDKNNNKFRKRQLCDVLKKIGTVDSGSFKEFQDIRLNVHKDNVVIMFSTFDWNKFVDEIFDLNRMNIYYYHEYPNKSINNKIIETSLVMYK